jgi:hypothetical protein
MVASVEELEVELIALSQLLTTPTQGECLFCYVFRMLNSHGCNGKLRWAARWRDLRAPRATALERRLGSRGGYCDCEIFMNGWTASSRITTYDFETDEEVWPSPMPVCLGVGPRSTQPCALWRRKPRGSW